MARTLNKRFGSIRRLSLFPHALIHKTAQALPFSVTKAIAFSKRLNRQRRTSWRKLGRQRGGEIMMNQTIDVGYRAIDSKLKSSQRELGRTAAASFPGRSGYLSSATNHAPFTSNSGLTVFSYKAYSTRTYPLRVSNATVVVFVAALACLLPSQLSWARWWKLTPKALRPEGNIIHPAETEYFSTSTDHVHSIVFPSSSFNTHKTCNNK